MTNVRTVNRNEGDQRSAAQQYALAPTHTCFLLFVERLPEEIDEEACGDGRSLTLREAGDYTAQGAGQSNTPVLRSLKENQHGDDCEKSAEPMMGGIQASEENEANRQGSRESDKAAAQYLGRGQRRQQNSGRSQTHHQQVWNPQQQPEMLEQEGVDQVGAGGYKLKVIAVGHLSCDDSGSVGCEQHLIGPGHDGDMRQNKFAEVTGGEGEGQSDRDQPAELYSARRLTPKRVVKGGRW